MLRHPGGRGPAVSSFHPLRNADASETRYNADPRDLIAGRRRAPLARGRDPGDLPLASALGGHPEPDRPRENYYGDVPRIIVSLLDETPEVRVWRLDPDSYEELAWERTTEDDAPP